MTADYRYRRLGYAALNVTDLARTVAFYTDVVGLDVTEVEEGRHAALRCGPDHHNILLSQADAPGLKRVGFEIESDADLDLAFSHLDRHGYAPAWVDDDEAAALCQGRSLRFRHPGAGLQFEYFVGMAQVDPFEARLAKIARLGHVVVCATEPAAMRDSLVSDLGFLVSDEVDGLVSFLRCFPNKFHHSFAVARGDENRLHHVNFMVTDIDDVGQALNRLKANDIEIVYGPGRHPPSGSIFVYFLDPDGMTVEYSFGMEEFEESGARQPRTLPPVPESLDFWGGVPSPAFAKVGRFEVAA